MSIWALQSSFIQVNVKFEKNGLKYIIITGKIFSILIG